MALNKIKKSMIDDELIQQVDNTTAQLAESLKQGEVSVSDIDKNKGKLDQTYMTDQFIAQFVENTQSINAVPKRNSITLDKMAYPSILGERSSNMFNKDTVLLNTTTRTDTGLTQPLDNYLVSDFISSDAESDYVVNVSVSSCMILFYDEEEVYLGSFHQPSNGVTFRTPIGTGLIRVRMPMSYLDTFQLQKGTVSTAYEPYVNYIKKESFKSKTIPIETMEEFERGINLYDYLVVKDDTFTSGSGSESTNTGYVSTEKLPIDSSKLSLASRFRTWFSFYNASKSFVSGTDGTTASIPANAAFVVVSFSTDYKGTQQVEYGTDFTKYEPYGYRLKKMIAPEQNIDFPSKKRDKLYTLGSAFVAWQNGEKFPVMFQGDSTTDGNATTGRLNGLHQNEDDAAGGRGRADYQPPNAYTSKLQELIREETGSTTARIYNGGYSGTALREGKDWLPDLLGHAYSDTKMMGIVYGINDRNRYSTHKAFETGFKSDLEYTVEFCFNKGIQPFMVTNQALADSGKLSEFPNYPLRTSEIVNSIANRLKHEVAEEYGLEIIEMTNFGEHLMEYSQESLNVIIPDRIHFGDYGHKKEAGFLFMQFCQRVFAVDGGKILTFSSQRIQSQTPADSLTYLEAFEDGFKVKADYTKGDTQDILIQDFWIFNYTRSELNLSAFVTNVGTQYVLLNDQNVSISSNGQIIGSLDIGVHRVRAFTGASDKVDFKGFKIENV